MLKAKRNYYTIDLPSDVTEDKDYRMNLAIEEANQRARKYVMPCLWQVIRDTGEKIRIVRIHY